MIKVTVGSRPSREEAFTTPLVDEPPELPQEQGPQSDQRMSLVYNSPQLHELVGKVHEQTVDNYYFNREYVQSLKHDKKVEDSYNYVRDRINTTIAEHAEDADFRTLTSEDRESVVAAVAHEILGYGPLEILLDDDSISDIMVNTYKQVYVERRGRGGLEIFKAISFRDNQHLLTTINRIVNEVQREVNERSPMVDARIDRVREDGSIQRIRINAIIEPLSIEGPVLSIRKFPQEHMKLWDLVQNQTLTKDMADLLEKICLAKLNVLISGGTGSGKTTLLNAMSGAIPKNDRVITIEDTAELHLQQDHVVRLETRPPNPNSDAANFGEITQRDLVKNSLRMRPDRIIVGEVRGNEALDMLQAMNTGHEGSLTTIHANSGRDALSRLETMVALASGNTSSQFIRQSISRAFHVVLHTARIGDSRKLMSIQELTSMQDDVITMQEIFAFEQTGLERGRVQGAFKAKGLRPDFLRRFQARSIPLPDPRIFMED